MTSSHDVFTLQHLVKVSIIVTVVLNLFHNYAGSFNSSCIYMRVCHNGSGIYTACILTVHFYGSSFSNDFR